MAASAREAIAEFVARGNVREAQASVALDQDRVSELQARLADLQDAATPIPDAEANPADFAAAVAEREAAAKEIQVHGRNVPRWNADHPIMQRVYGAHDAVAGLPAPGGLGAILAIIAVLFFVLIGATAQGETRTLLLWDVLLGKKRVPLPDELALDQVVGGFIQGADQTIGGFLHFLVPAIPAAGLGNTSATTPAADVQLGMPGEPPV